MGLYSYISTPSGCPASQSVLGLQLALYNFYVFIKFLRKDLSSRTSGNGISIFTVTTLYWNVIRINFEPCILVCLLICCWCFSESGDVYSWGYGVLGHGKEVSFTKTPKRIQEFDNIDEPVARVCCGPDYMTVITGWWPLQPFHSKKVTTQQLHGACKLSSSLFIFQLRSCNCLRSLCPSRVVR